jgi:predicted transcriptional regulator of viral defense system
MPQQAAEPRWHTRSPERLPDADWRDTLTRVRSEFQEMPCTRVTMAQARALFGLPTAAAAWILQRLEDDGFLSRTAQGEYMRRPEAL